MMISTGVIASSASGRRAYVGLNSVMYQAATDITRSKAHSFVSVYVDSVYPPTGTDTYSKIKAALYHPDVANLRISEIYTIWEGGGAQVAIREGYLGLERVDLCFAGNDPRLDAYVIYGFDGH